MVHLQGSPLTSVNSNYSSVSDPPSPLLLLEELDSGNNHGYNVEQKQLLGMLNELLQCQSYKVYFEVTCLVSIN